MGTYLQGATDASNVDPDSHEDSIDVTAGRGTADPEVPTACVPMDMGTI